MTICPSCAAECSVDDERCPKCGTELAGVTDATLVLEGDPDDEHTIALPGDTEENEHAGGLSGDGASTSTQSR